MGRTKRDAEKINFRVDKQLMYHLRAYAYEHDMTYTAAIEKILREFFDQPKSPSAQVLEAIKAIEEYKSEHPDIAKKRGSK